MKYIIMLLVKSTLGSRTDESNICQKIKINIILDKIGNITKMCKNFNV